MRQSKRNDNVNELRAVLSTGCEANSRESWMKYESELSAAAAALGRLGGMKGGKSRSAAKVAAVRENGRKGGRPKGAKNRPKQEVVSR